MGALSAATTAYEHLTGAASGSASPVGTPQLASTSPATPADSSVVAAAPTAGAQREWACAVCTLGNEASTSSCAACGAIPVLPTVQGPAAVPPETEGMLPSAATAAAATSLTEIAELCAWSIGPVSTSRGEASRSEWRWATAPNTRGEPTANSGPPPGVAASSNVDDGVHTAVPSETEDEAGGRGERKRRPILSAPLGASRR